MERRIRAIPVIVTALALVSPHATQAGKPVPPPFIHTDCSLAAGLVGNVSAVTDDGFAAGSGETGVLYLDCKQSAAMLWDARSKPSAAPPLWVDPLEPGCDYCHSYLADITPDGTLASGVACDVGDGPPPDCFCFNRAVVWEGGPYSLVRTFLDDPLPERRGRAEGVARVGSQTIAVGHGGVQPAVDGLAWRKVGIGEWSRGLLPTAGFPGVRPRSINGSGLVAGRTSSGPESALAWRCTTDPCEGPYVLGVGQAEGISELGDIAGRSGPNGAVWRYLGDIGPGPTWTAAELLPTLQKGTLCSASAVELVDGVLTAVGRCTVRYDEYGVRWRKVGGVWSKPEKLESLDDSSARLEGALDISTSGRIGGGPGLYPVTQRGWIISPNP